MFQKFASLDVLEVKSAPSQVRSASLSKFADFNDYRTDDGYVYVRVRAISSRVNKNNDGWPSAELEKSWRSFIGKPIFVDHHNSDPKRARGVIVDAALHVDDLKTASLDPYYATAPENHKPPTWIELLLEVDAKKFPRLAKAIVSGDIDSVSMGANVEMSKCSHCGNEAYSPEQFCKHVQSKGAYFDYFTPDGTKTSRRSYEDCHGIGFFEISFVFDPADETALVSDIKTASRRKMIAAIQTEGSLPLYEQPTDDYGDFDSGDYYNRDAEEAERLYMWRVKQFMELGYSPEQAEEFAANETDYHPYEKMIGQGATPDQAHAILARKTAGPFGMADPEWEGEPARPMPMWGDAVGVSPNAPQGGEDKQVWDWRYEEFLRMGYPPERAAEMAGGNQFDLRGVENMLGQGATPDQAYQIHASLKTADRNPLPQSDMTTAPEKVDTLRQEQVCPICGSDMEDGICEVCNYEEPPEGFDNPDLTKAKEVDEQIHQQDAQQAAQGQTGTPNDVEPGASGAPAPMPSGAMPATSSTGKNIGTSALNNEKTSANNDGRVNTQERPILPVTRQLSDKPVNVKTISTAQKIESNQKDKDNNHMTDTIKTADGATPQGAGVQAEKRVDVVGVGAVSGDPLSGIDHENVENDTGDFVAPHTDTWTGGEGDSLGQQDPVTSEVFEGGGQGTGNAVGVSSPPPHNSAVKVACDCCADCGSEKCKCQNHKESSTRTADTSGDLGGPIGEAVGEGEGGAVGGPTWDSSASGFPDHDPSRVSLLGELKEEVGERTQTDSNEQFRSLKRTEPVTKGEDANDLGGPIGVAVASAKARLLKAVKVAEAEVAMGLTPVDEKFDRVSELENADESTLDATLSTLSRVKTAGLQKKTTSSTAPAGAGRMPSLAKTASFDIEAHSVGEDPFADSLM